MDRWRATFILPGALALLGVALLAHWGFSRPDLSKIVPRVPGMDGAPAAGAGGGAPLDMTGVLTKGPGKASEVQVEWPWFRGTKLDNISTEKVARKFAAGGPKQLWHLELGEGYAGPAVSHGRVYLLDYLLDADKKNGKDVLRCLSLDDGKELWSRAYVVDVPRNHGITRTVPAIAWPYVITIGPKCHVVCVNGETGDYVWGIDLVAQHGTVVPQWYAGQCPLIDDGKLILAPGGPEALVMAVEIASGKVLWKTPNPRKWFMTHSSVMPLELGGKRMYVYCGTGGVAGVDAADGKILWETTDWRVKMANVPTPVYVGDGRIFFSGGYGAGALMGKVSEAGGKFAFTTLFILKPEQFGAEQHTPVFYKNHLFAVIPGGQLICIDLDGKRKWASGGRFRFGIGPFMIADDTIILMDDRGKLSLVEANPQAFKLITQANLWEEGHEAWGPFALVEGRLLARDLTRMVCLEMRSEK